MPGLDAEMIAALRAELQRAYSLIMTLEAAAPGSTPAIFKSLLKEHQFCLFCGAASTPGSGSPIQRLRPPSGFRVDDEAELVLNGGAGFVKFWYGKGVAGYGGRSGAQASGAPPPVPTGRRAPGAGPAGWGGGGSVGAHDGRPQTSPDVLPGPGTRRARSMEDVGSQKRPHSTSGVRESGRPNTPGSLASLPPSVGGASGLGSATFGFSAPTAAGEMSTQAASEMLARSGHPSAVSMSRRLKRGSLSSGGTQNIPSFRPGTALAEPHPHAAAAEASRRAGGMRRPATADPPGSVGAGGSMHRQTRGAAMQLAEAAPRLSASAQGSRGAKGSRGRGKSSRGSRAEPQVAGQLKGEDKSGHIQRFLDGMEEPDPADAWLPPAVEGA